MREIVPGHLYETDCLKASIKGRLKFYRDPALHETGWDGPSTQEVIRCCVARVKHLDTEVHWWGNRWIIGFLRASIFLFEIRALFSKAHKAKGIENLQTRKDGHVY